MPSAPTSKLFIPQELTGGSLVFVKYLAQIGNRREKLGKGNELIPSARIRDWPDQAGSSPEGPCTNALSQNHDTMGNGLGSWCCRNRGRALWSRYTASCGLARLRRAATGLFLWFSPPQANRGAGDRK